jgi:hypothetical protein
MIIVDNNPHRIPSVLMNNDANDKVRQCQFRHQFEAKLKLMVASTVYFQCGCFMIVTYFSQMIGYVTA